MAILLLLRHGIAEDFAPERMRGDQDRHLTEEGRAKIAAQLPAIVAMKLDIACVLASPYPRAQETAEITAQALELEVETSDLLTPQSWPEAILVELAKRKREVPTLLVGHEPHLSGLASRVLSGGGDLAIELKKGGLIALNLPKMSAPFHGELMFSIPPKALRLMAVKK